MGRQRGRGKSEASWSLSRLLSCKHCQLRTPLHPPRSKEDAVLLRLLLLESHPGIRAVSQS